MFLLMARDNLVTSSVHQPMWSRLVIATYLWLPYTASYMYNTIINLQDDILVGTLTVKENLMFSATLRLPASYTWKEQKKKVDHVITELGLEKVANSTVRIAS